MTPREHCKSEQASSHKPRLSDEQALWKLAVIQAAFPYEIVRPEIIGLDKQLWGISLPSNSKKYAYADFTSKDCTTVVRLVAEVLGVEIVKELAIIYKDEPLRTTLFDALRAHHMSFDALSSAPLRAKQKYTELMKRIE